MARTAEKNTCCSRIAARNQLRITARRNREPPRRRGSAFILPPLLSRSLRRLFCRAPRIMLPSICLRSPARGRLLLEWDADGQAQPPLRHDEIQ